jgi:hypothetical protein
LKRSPFLGHPELENSGVMKRSPFLGHPELENSGVRAHSGGDAGEPFMSAIGGLLLARTAAGAVAEQADNLSDPSRPTRVWISYRRQSVRERSSCAFPMCTSPAAQQEFHCHRLTLGRQILEAAAGPAMPTSASPSTIRADADRGSRSRNNPPVVNSERDTQYLDPWAGDHFDFVRMPPIASTSLTANEPHKVRKNLIKCQVTQGTPRGARQTISPGTSATSASASAMMRT